MMLALDALWQLLLSAAVVETVEIMLTTCHMQLDLPQTEHEAAGHNSDWPAVTWMLAVPR